MATFSDDFGSASGTADVNSPTAISGWTGDFPAGSSSNINATIQAVGGTVSGNVLRLADTGHGESFSLRPTSIGNVAANTITEALCGWRTASGITSSNVWNHGTPCMRVNTSNRARFYSNGIKTVAGVDTLRLWYAQDANEWASIGAAYDVSSTYTHGDWWWTRINVDASGNWLWRSWKDGDAEPGSWQNASAGPETTITGGYCGVSLYRNLGVGTQLDIQWFSMGTSGDAAPDPSASQSNAPRSNFLRMMQGA